MRIPIILAALGAALIVLGWTNPVSARNVCVPFVQNDTVMMEADFFNICFKSESVRRIKPIYSGKSGNMVEVILADGTRFFKNGLSKSGMQRCVNGGSCDKYQNVKLRDLTTGTKEQLAKLRRPSPGWRDRNRCAVGNLCDGIVSY